MKNLHRRLCICRVDLTDSRPTTTPAGVGFGKRFRSHARTGSVGFSSVSYSEGELLGGPVAFGTRRRSRGRTVLPPASLAVTTRAVEGAGTETLQLAMSRRDVMTRRDGMVQRDRMTRRDAMIQRVGVWSPTSLLPGGEVLGRTVVVWTVSWRSASTYPPWLSPFSRTSD